MPRAAIDGKAAVATLRRADPILGQLMRVVGPFALDVQRTASVFQVLSEAIVAQQLSAKAAVTIYGRVRGAASGGGPLTAAGILGTPDSALRAAGLSGAKTAALKDLAAHEEAGELPNLARIRRMDDDAIVERLTVVRGIGRWTVEMFLIFRLGRPDVLPIDDYGVRRAFGLVYGRDAPTPKELAAHGAQWAPYRTVASWYLWRALELPRDGDGQRAAR
jgi:3-methyladenine DNA glycosylase/8-oxoguanine DNA glycosylase